MTLAQSKWAGSSTDLVLSALDARRASAGAWAVNSTSPLDVRAGVVYTGDSTLLTATASSGPATVNVDPLHFLCVKDPSNGVYEGTNYSQTTVNLPAAPSLGNKRIDVLWVVQQDKNAAVGADAVTAATFGVMQGTASASAPAKPSLVAGVGGVIAGAVEVGTITWDSTSVVATASNAAQCTLATTCNWTAAKGAPIPVRSAAERNALTGYEGLRVVRLDNSSTLDTYTGGAWVAGDTGWVSLTIASGWSSVVNYPLQYRIRDNMVYVQGAVSYNSGTTITTLPAGARPAGNTWLTSGVANGSAAYTYNLHVSAAGIINIPAGYSTGSASTGMIVPVFGSFLLG